jgi:hypothetical protein
VQKSVLGETPFLSISPGFDSTRGKLMDQAWAGF